ncbi:hypothetical protein L1987_17355 [Smallanthus sonchifolius]|uniref:Uncharacterized protein n=1 Tax=Smallanthus sonchifolius TaxID=185202 RepID=A0ACB9IYU3_9ASTR|nr:hypothetical protein L1987_17355 [Smallanthus sonchifolius]
MACLSSWIEFMFLILAFQLKFYPRDCTNFICMKSVMNYMKNFPSHLFLHLIFGKVKEGANSQKFYVNMTSLSWTIQNNMRVAPYYHYL